MRLNKFLALAGVASRRRADELIEEGLVQVNGETVKKLGVQVDPEKDHVKVEGKRVGLVQGPPVYLVLHKPAKVVVTRIDPEGRATVFDLLKQVPNNIFHVGRLDYDTEGLLLLTNDGTLAHQLTLSKLKIPRTYLAKVKGVPDEKVMQKLQRGMTIEGVRLAPISVNLKRKENKNSWLEMTVTEGHNLQIRKMYEYVGHSVIKLKRISFGPLTLADLPVGSSRYLQEEEVAQLKDFAGQKEGELRGKPAVLLGPKRKKGWARPGKKKGKKKRSSGYLPSKSL